MKQYMTKMFVVTVGFLLLVGNAAGATEEAKLIAALDGAADDTFGWSVSVDGDTAVIGANGDGDAGSAYVFTRSDGTWTQQAKLNASDGAAGDQFGWSVSVDGDTVVIGAYNADDMGYNSGSAYVFTRSGTTWTQQAKLNATDGAVDDRFGHSVSVDGDTAVIGTYSDDDMGYNSGSAYVFTRSGGVWTQQAKLIAALDGAENDRFGHSVSADGDTAVIGTYSDDDMGFNSGSAYVFTRSGGVWTQQAKLIAVLDGAADDQLGYSVSVDGDTAVIGADAADDSGYNSGSAYVFTRSGTTWTQQAKLNATDGAADDHFGTSVSVDGDTAVIGAYTDDDMGDYSGSAYVFTRNGGTWTQQTKLTAIDGAEFDIFGGSVSVDGDTAVVGAWGDNYMGYNSGSAYVYLLDITGGNFDVPALTPLGIIGLIGLLGIIGVVRIKRRL